MKWPEFLGSTKLSSLQNISVVFDVLGGFLGCLREGSRVEVQTNKDSYSIGIVTKLLDSGNSLMSH